MKKIILNIKLIKVADGKGKINENKKTTEKRRRKKRSKTRPSAKALAKTIYASKRTYLEVAELYTNILFLKHLS